MEPGPTGRRCALAAVSLALGLAAAAAFGAFEGGGHPVKRGAATVTIAAPKPRSAATAQQAPPRHFATVGVRTLELYDRSRGRRLVTLLLYPALTAHPAGAQSGAPAATGPFPLVVFGHGFAVTPKPYRPLLDRWVRAGFVVAAPIFPRENELAPGGPSEQDLPNQPRDMTYVIEALRSLSAPGGELAGLLSGRVAVAGQSDGGDTALAAAFDPANHSIPIDAAVILSGAEDPFAARFRPQGGTPLLATQGTADTVNLPSETLEYFTAAGRPKYLLLLEGAEHQAPYTRRGPELDAVARTSIAFLDRYLKGEGRPLGKLAQAGSAGARTRLRSYP